MSAQLERETAELRRMVLAVARSGDAGSKRKLDEQMDELRKRMADHLVERMIVNRPALRSRGKPTAYIEAQRGLAEARRRLSENRDADNLDSRCPAAQTRRTAAGDVSVVCGVTDSVMTGRSDPQSLLTFCFGNCDACPVWRAERELMWARKKPLSEQTA